MKTLSPYATARIAELEAMRPDAEALVTQILGVVDDHIPTLEEALAALEAAQGEDAREDALEEYERVWGVEILSAIFEEVGKDGVVTVENGGRGYAFSIKSPHHRIHPIWTSDANGLISIEDVRGSVEDAIHFAVGGFAGTLDDEIADLMGA